MSKELSWPPKDLDELNRMRKRSGKGTDGAVADLMGVARTTVRNWRRAHEVPTVQYAYGRSGPPIACARDRLCSEIGEEAITALYDDQTYMDDPRPVRNRNK